MIELLVGFSIMALLLSLLLPALSRAREDGRRARCLANLKQQGTLAHEYAAIDEQSRLHGSATTGHHWVGDGGWDFGGANGLALLQGVQAWGSTAGGPANNGGYPQAVPSARRLGATTRPLNRVMYGPNPPDEDYDTGGNTTYEIFRCPSDSGAPIENPNVNAVYSSDEIWYDTNGIFKATGNSYKGDFIRILPNLRFGAFLRPINMIASPGEMLLFYEDRFALALISAEEWSDISDATPVDVMGWHGRLGRFQAVFTDGHAASVKLMKEDLYPREQFEPLAGPNWEVVFRGPGWRYDGFPSEPIAE